jgi:hypothetical protein
MIMKPLKRPGGRSVHVPAKTVTPVAAEGEGILSAHVGMPPKLGKVTGAAKLRQRALPQPGSHAALLKRLFGS